MATLSSILSWEMLCTEKTGGLQYIRSKSWTVLVTEDASHKHKSFRREKMIVHIQNTYYLNNLNTLVHHAII